MNTEGSRRTAAMRQPDQTAGPERATRKSFLRELRDREVFQTAGAYAVVAWGVTEIVDGVVSRLGWPEWLATGVVILFVMGFPVAMFLAWAFDLTAQGIRRDQPWKAGNWASITAAALFLLAGSAALFWLINPSGIVHVDRIGVTVMPCRYRGDDAYRFRGEGLAGIIQIQLAYIPTLRVPVFAPVAELADRNLPTAELARLAGVAWMVDCRLGQSNGRWTLDVALVDARTDTSESLLSLDVDESDLADASQTAARAIAGRLGPTPPSEEPHAGPGPFPSHAASLDAYLLGERAMRTATAEAYRQAREHFRQAQSTPGFVLARIREADALMAFLEIERPARAGQARASLRAIGLMLDAAEAKNPSVAELYAARMRLDTLTARLEAGKTPDLDQQRDWFDLAVALRPSYAEPYRLLAEALRLAGAEDEASELAESAHEFDPLR